MRFHGFVLAVLFATVMSGCATAPTDIRVDTVARPGADLAAYRTYAWLETAQVVNDPQGGWQAAGLDTNAALKDLIERQLQGKGMRRVTAEPDLVVAFGAGVNTGVFELAENRDTEMLNLRNSPRGALVVVLIDPASRAPVWLGRALGDVRADRPAAEARRRLRYAVQTMFADFRR